jgi:hypothetical protein
MLKTSSFVALLLTVLVSVHLAAQGRGRGAGGRGAAPEFLEHIRKNPTAANPYLYGPERFARWMDIMIECGRARLAALGVQS